MRTCRRKWDRTDCLWKMYQTLYVRHFAWEWKFRVSLLNIIVIIIGQNENKFTKNDTNIIYINFSYLWFINGIMNCIENILIHFQRCLLYYNKLICSFLWFTCIHKNEKCKAKWKKKNHNIHECVWTQGIVHL